MFRVLLSRLTPFRFPRVCLWCPGRELWGPVPVVNDVDQEDEYAPRGFEYTVASFTRDEGLARLLQQQRRLEAAARYE